jgi:hypothetical protein
MNLTQHEDRIFGLHSNIPSCCVEFYISAYLPVILHWQWLGNEYMPPLLARAIFPKFRRKKTAQYIQCPVCALLGNVQKLHICNRNCPPEMLRIRKKLRTW